MTATYYVQVIVTLAVFMAVMIAFVKFGKSVQKKKFAGDIRVVDRLAVDQGVSILIVEVRDQSYLISIGGKDVKVLERL